MQTKKPTEMSNEELLQHEKKVKKSTYLLFAALILLVIMYIFRPAEKKSTALMVLPMAFIPIVIVNLNTLKEIKKELKSRNV